MLNDFFRINLPYGIAKNKDDEWMAFNREYMPLGYNNTKFKGNPCESFLESPIYTKYKGVTDKLLKELAQSENAIIRNEKNDIIQVFLYSDSTNPQSKSSDNKTSWDNYFNKIKKLSKLSIKK